MTEPVALDPKLHEWRIDALQYERQENRRGRRHAFEHLDPARTALIVIDVIPFFVKENPYCRGIIPNIAQLADVLREAGGTVAWVLPAVLDDIPAVKQEFFGPRIAKLFNESGGSGPLASRLWHEFEVHEHDLLVENHDASAFFPGRSHLPSLLVDRDISTVLITGTVTDVCCSGSARDASTLGYRVIMVADATAGTDDYSHNATLRTIYRTFGDVRPTSEVLGLIGDVRNG